MKCDIKKFFANIDHQILLDILSEYISDKNILSLLENIIESFVTKNKNSAGLPLGNLTSQLFVNIYMNKFDQHIKRILKVKYYIRYADDFVVLSEDKKYLKKILCEVINYLNDRLKLSLNYKKVSIETLVSGVDFLGWVNFTYYRVLRTKTKKRMFKNIKNNPSCETLNSYLGLIKHGNSRKIINEIVKFII